LLLLAWVKPLDRLVPVC